MNDYIINDINYSLEDINELVEFKGNSYGTIIGMSASALLFGVCNVANASTSNTYLNSQKIQSKSQIEVVATESSDFLLEEYQNVFLENYNLLWCNDALENKKKECIESILSFKSLQESWDGYGALPLEVKSASNTIEFLENLDLDAKFSAPTDIFPNPTGTVSLIWENEEEERLSLEIGNEAYSYYTKFNTIEPEFFNDVEINESNIGNIIRKIKALY